jgi:hypothetical protein
LKPDPLDPAEWCDRCAKRFTELDLNISKAEAQELAQDVYAFERTHVMNPEAAANFVAHEMSRPDRVRFERRSVDRSQRQPFLKRILRILTPGAQAL